MKIHLDKAIDLINASAAVIVSNDGNMPVIYASIDEEIFLYWEVDGLEYDVTISFENNEAVEISKDSLIFKDSEGKDVVLKLLFPSKLASFCQKEDFIS